MPNKIFVHAVRYEDLLEHPKEALTDLSMFLLDTNALEHTYAQSLIEHLTSNKNNLN